MVTRTLQNGKNEWPTDYGENNNGRDDIRGTQDADFIDGGFGNDVIRGRGGDDILDGGGGSDELHGGPGRDTFLYNSVADSPASNRDVIVNFNPNFDIIILEPIDADVTTPGNQDFTLIFDQFFSGTPGELRIDTFWDRIEGDVDGGGSADFRIDFWGGTLPTGGGNVAAFSILSTAAKIDSDLAANEDLPTQTFNTDLVL